VLGIVDLESNISRPLWTAIENRRLIRLFYKNKERIVEPHDYGIRDGLQKLLAFQVAGASSHKLPNWRWMDVNSIANIELLNQTFAGGRSAPSGKHHKWDKVIH
jgi:hypothetical protein